MRLYQLAPLALALVLPLSQAQACFDNTVTEVSFEGDPNGSEPFKLTTPESPGNLSLTWVDDDGLPTILTILQAAESGQDVSTHGDLFKKSLIRLKGKAEEYGKSTDDDDAKAHYKKTAEGAEKFLKKYKDKPLDKKALEAFYKEMSDPLYGSIVDGMFGYELRDPKTGKLNDPSEPTAPVGYFDPAGKFVDKIDGAVARGCGAYSFKVKPSKSAGKSGSGKTFMVNPGQ